MKVIPTSRWIDFSSICMAWRSLRSRAPSGSSSRITRGRLISARARATLAVAPRTTGPACVPETSQVHHFQGFGHPPIPLVPFDSPHLEAIADVLLDCHMGEQRVILKDRIDVALVGGEIGYVLSVKQDSPIGGGARSRRLCAGRWSSLIRMARAGKRTHRRERREKPRPPR